MSSSVVEPTTRRLFDLLERQRKLRRGRSGDPALTRLDTVVGHARGHLRRQLKGEIRMSVEDLFRVFELLEVDPEEFISAARHDRIPLDLWLAEMAREDRHQLQLLRFEGEETSPRDVDAELRRLDELLRLGEPEATDSRPYLAALAALDGQHSPEAERLRFRVWDLLGASFRASACYSASAHCYRQALGLSSGHQLDQARILRRACYLATSQCEVKVALGFADQAQEIYRRELELPDIGRTWIDSAITLDLSGRSLEAISRFEAGLKILDDDPYYRIAAELGLGICHFHSGNVSAAQLFLKRAQDLYRQMATGPSQLTGLHWLSAELAMQSGDLFTSRVLFEKIQSIHEKGRNPFDLALVSLRLAKTLLGLADFEALEQLTARTSLLMSFLQRHPFAQTTLIEFYRLSIERQLTGKILDRLFFDFKKSGRATR